MLFSFCSVFGAQAKNIALVASLANIPMPSYTCYARFESCEVAATINNVKEYFANGEFDKLGPTASYRLNVCWITGFLETFPITEAMMVARKWKLREFVNEGMILEHPKDPVLMLARPLASVPQQVIQVEVEQLGNDNGLNNEVLVSAYRISGKCVYEGVHLPEFTWQDLYKIMFLQNKEEFYLVKFITTYGSMVPRAYYRQRVTSPIPIEPIEQITKEPEEPELKKRKIV